MMQATTRMTMRPEVEACFEADMQRMGPTWRKMAEGLTVVKVLKESEIAPDIPEAVSSGRWYLFCPGCYLNAKARLPEENERVWLNGALHCFNERAHNFNGDVKNPTLYPSLLCQHMEGEGDEQVWYRCHSYVENGTIRYLDDCDHPFRGRSVELLDAQRFLDAYAQPKEVAPAFEREGQHEPGHEPITTHIHIAHDFSRYPGGRFKDDGPHSAEHLRDDLIVPVLSRGNHVAVHLDGTYGLCSSFLEEAFGGLVRRGYDAQTLRRVLTIETTHAAYLAKVWNYIDFADEMARAGGEDETAPSTAGAQSG